MYDVKFLFVFCINALFADSVIHLVLTTRRHVCNTVTSAIGLKLQSYGVFHRVR